MLFIICMGFTALTSGAVVIGNARGPHPHRRWEWQCTPTLRIASDVPERAGVVVAEAWLDMSRLGADLGPAVYGDSQVADGYCEIVVHELQSARRPEANGWATRPTFDPHTWRAVSAVVEVPEDATRLVALHELLHVMGWGHTNTNGHVMNGRTRDMGTDMRGIDFGGAR